MTLTDKAYNNIYTVGSHMMDPLCNTRSFHMEKIVTDSIYSKTSINKRKNINNKLALKTTLSGVMSCITTPFALIYRAIMYPLCDQNFLFDKGTSEKYFNNELGILSWNIWCVPAGYSISDGGLMPWQNRIEKIIKKIKNDRCRCCVFV